MSIGPFQWLTKSGQSIYQPLCGTPNVLAASNWLTNGKLAPRVGFEPTASRLTAERMKNLSALSGVAYEKLGAIFLHLVAPTPAPTVG